MPQTTHQKNPTTNNQAVFILMNVSLHLSESTCNCDCPAVLVGIVNLPINKIFVSCTLKVFLRTSPVLQKSLSLVDGNDTEPCCIQNRMQNLFP